MQNLNQRTVNVLNKGLITEFAELTFPEGASVDELNCSLSRDGSRARRLGLEFEQGNVLSSFDVDPAEVVYTGTWENPGGVSGLTFMVVQAGATLYFYNAGVFPYSEQYTGLSLDLTPYQIAGKDISLTKVEFATIASSLVVASEAINTVYLSYNGSAITATQIEFRVRDFDWISDVCDLTERIPTSTVTAQRKYDTLNAGWTGNYGDDIPNDTDDFTLIGLLIGGTMGVVDIETARKIRLNGGLTALETYVNSRNAWPPLTHPWYSGKNSSGDFDLAAWEKVYSGSSLIGNGHFVFDFFNKDRNLISGLTGIPTEVETNRFKTVSTYAGRMFYAGLGAGKNSGKILYSRIVESIVDSSSCTIIGECYQQNDPTAEYYSDLLETDGGVIHIPEAYNIKKLYTHNQYLYVFAENGVWVVSGPENKFSATSYYVSKVSNIGIYSTGSFVSAEGVPFWWSKYGIHTFAYDESSGYPMEQNLSIGTIQSFWDALDVNAKDRVVSAYDRVNKQIFWLYPENGEALLNKRTRVLILDIQLQAFYPWQIADSTTYPMGFYFFDSYGSEAFEDEVTDSLDAIVTDSLGDSVYVTNYNLLSTSQTQLSVITFTEDKLTISAFTDKTFLDWGENDYDAYVECGYDFGGDLLLKKSAPYVTTYCRVTEEGFGPAPDYTPINPSGLYMEVYWDFKKLASTRQQIYRVKPAATVNTDDLSDNQQTKNVVTSRLKVRGSGRSMRLRFQAEEGKNFVLLGYSVLLGANARF
jgi:hypothetical protein